MKYIRAVKLPTDHRAADEYPESDPRHHTKQVKRMFRELADHLREDERKVDEPGAQAMFGTAAQVLEGLIAAFDAYESRGL